MAFLKARYVSASVSPVMVVGRVLLASNTVICMRSQIQGATLNAPSTSDGRSDLVRVDYAVLQANCCCRILLSNDAL